MLACVCQPTETALLFKGGSPVAMGPLSANRLRHTTDTMKAIKLVQKPVRQFSDDAKDSSASLTSSPSLVESTSLLNLRMIERRAKSTKILVNPVCSDVCTSDDSNRSNANSKWNGKKKRLKAENGHKNVDRIDKNDPISRNEAKKDKKSVSCFKIKSSDDKRSEEDGKLGKENCKNENASNLRSSEKPDVINHSRKNKEILVDEGTMTDETSFNIDQLDKGKTDTVLAIKKHEVRKTYDLHFSSVACLALFFFCKSFRPRNDFVVAEWVMDGQGSSIEFRTWQNAKLRRTKMLFLLFFFLFYLVLILVKTLCMFLLFESHTKRTTSIEQKYNGSTINRNRSSPQGTIYMLMNSLECSVSLLYSLSGLIALGLFHSLKKCVIAICYFQVSGR